MYKLPELGYAYDALEPHIDAKTMEIHHTKHHQAYITGLNTVIEAHPELASWSLEDLLRKWNTLPESAKPAIRNHGGGHHNHSLFWTILGKTNMPAELEKSIVRDFGSVEKLKEEFETAAKTRFGSGWAWLSVCKHGKLHVTSTPNQDSPLMEDSTPILGLDVWEHAYYLNYQNRRPDYVSAFWNIVNWEKVEELRQQALTN